MSEALFGLVLQEVARSGGGEAELYVTKTRVRRYEARGGGIDSISFSDALALGVRVFREGRMGFSYGFRDSEEEIVGMVESALFSADASDPDPAYGLPDSDGLASDSPSTFPDLPLYDPAWENVDDREKAEFAAGLERATLALDPRMKRVREASLKETVAKVRFWNSAGRSGFGRLSHYQASVESVAEEKGEGQTGYGFGFARRFRDLSLDAVAKEAAGRTVRMFGSRSPRSGRWPAILENGAAAELLEVLIPSLLASQVAKGKSMLGGKLGQEVVSAKVSLVDDPLAPEGSGATTFDGEGMPSRVNALVERGVLKGFLSDSFWGRKLGTGSTASCRRTGPKLPPSVGISNLRLFPGSRTLEEMRKEMGRGILLTEFLGIHTADPVSGDFSVGAAGIRFEGGQEKEPLRGFAVSGNVLALFSQVTEVGSDFRWFGPVGTPSLALSGIDVGGE